MIGLGGAEFRLPLLIGIFGFVALQAVILNKAMSLIVVITALPARLLSVPYSDVAAHWYVIVNLLAGSLVGVLARYCEELGFSYNSHRPSDAESVVTIVRITGGNFRLIERLMSQVAGIMKINKLDTITPTPSKPPARCSSSAPDLAR